MSKACPAVEVAAVTKVSNSVTDEPRWLAYFSPAGKKSIASGNSPDDMIWTGEEPDWLWIGKKKRYSFEFCQLEDYEGTAHELDAFAARGNKNLNDMTALILRPPQKNI